jgi:hypothetical protein
MLLTESAVTHTRPGCHKHTAKQPSSRMAYSCAAPQPSKGSALKGKSCGLCEQHNLGSVREGLRCHLAVPAARCVEHAVH